MTEPAGRSCLFVSSDARRTARTAAATLLGLSLACAALAAQAQAPWAGGAANTANTVRKAPLGAPSPPPTYTTIGWDALVAPGWDGMREFRQLDLNSMGDGDPRAKDLLQRMRAAWDQAPVNLALVGRAVRIAGYVVPLESTAQGLREFLLVPYHGACIHTPPPPANQIVHVNLRTPVKDISTMDTVWVSGVLAYTRNETYMGTASWTLPAVDVSRHSDSLKAQPLR